MKAKLFYPSPRVPRPTKTRFPRILLSLWLLVLAIILVSSTADAHGIGYYEIRGAKVDPYTVHVWVSPGYLRTGDVHIDTAVFDTDNKPALGVLVNVAFVPLENNTPPLQSLAGMPDVEYPHSRGATFTLDTPGNYRLEISVSDPAGNGGTTSVEVEVASITLWAKASILAVLALSTSTMLWLLYQTRLFWIDRYLRRHINTTTHSGKFDNIRVRAHSMDRLSQFRLNRAQLKINEGGVENMMQGEMVPHRGRMARLSQRLNGVWHAPALWIYMLIVVAHWMEHVLQIYQIYALGWDPDKAGGILGVIYPDLIESETLHFVYDFIQWAGIVILLPGFREAKARRFWIIALIFQTWHFIEHILLMGQFLSGYYLFGAPTQISILQLWFPRAELHFAYNLLVFIPMVIAAHYYLQPKLDALNALRNAQSSQSEDQ